MVLNRYALHDEIDADHARALWVVSGGNTREITTHVYAPSDNGGRAGSKLLTSYRSTLTKSQYDSLIENADALNFWHFGYDRECSREVQVCVGNVTVTVNVKDTVTLDRPNYSE